MPTYSTPGPVTATIESGAGDIRITASDRSDTIVTIEPRNHSRAADRRAAEQVTAELAGDDLSIKGVKVWRKPFGGFGVVDITVELPTGSHVTASTGMGTVSAQGELGRVDATSAMGDIAIDRMASGRARTSMGDIRIDRVDGDLDVSTSTGEVRVGDVGGSVVCRNSNGASSLGHVTGDVRVKAANGRIDIEQADRSVVSKTANGSTRVGRVGTGDVHLASGAGGIEIGIPLGTAAWLDLGSKYGEVRNELDTAHGPDAADRTVKVSARTGAGDIVVRRSSPATAGGPTGE